MRREGMNHEKQAVAQTKKFDELGILVVMIALFVFLAVASPFFLKVENIQNLLLQSVFVMLVGFGMTFVLPSAASTFRWVRSSDIRAR